MFLKEILAIYAALILVTASVATAEDVTAEGQVSVTLTLPYQELLQGELRPNSTIELTNNSLDKLHYIPEGSWADALQIFLKVDRTISIPSEHRRKDYDPDIETYGQWERVREFASSELKPGQSVAWKATNIPYFFFAISSPIRKAKSIQAQVLIGPGKWVSSKPVRIKFLKQKLRDFPVVFENDYLTGPQRAKSPIAVYRVAIKNKEYLFTSSCFRICEIPKNSKPDFIWEPRLGLLKIDFKIDHVPLVWFHYTMLEHLDSDQSITEFYRKKYHFKYGDADYKQRAFKGMASHGTAASVQLFDQCKGSNELLLEHRDRHECMRLLLNRAKKKQDIKQARQLILQALFAGELQLDEQERISLPPLVRQENEARKTAEFIDEFVKNTGPTVLTKGDRAKIEALISHIKEKQEPVAVDCDWEVPKISAELLSLSDSDIQTLGRDALVRFASTYTDRHTFRLTRSIDWVNCYSDSEQNPGKLEWNGDRFIREQGPYAPNVREVFGDYDSLPESVREVVLNEGGPVADGDRLSRPLALKSLAWSKEQRKVQITLYQSLMPWMSFTFLYRVEDDGALRFIRSEAMGCSSPEGYFIKEASE